MLNTDTIFTITAVVVPLVEMLGIIKVVHAVMNSSPSQSAIAWGTRQPFILI